MTGPGEEAEQDATTMTPQDSPPSLGDSGIQDVFCGLESPRQQGGGGDSPGGEADMELGLEEEGGSAVEPSGAAPQSSDVIGEQVGVDKLTVL